MTENNNNLEKNDKDSNNSESNELKKEESVKTLPESDATTEQLKPIIEPMSDTTKQKLEKAFLKRDEKAKKQEVKDVKKKETTEKVGRDIKKILHDQFHGILDEEDYVDIFHRIYTIDDFYFNSTPKKIYVWSYERLGK
jgi:hypothetical protein